MDEIPQQFIRKVDFHGAAASAAVPNRETAGGAGGYAPKSSTPKPFIYRPAPTKKEPPKCKVGDRVRVAKYGEGEVLDIQPAGADYEITISFPTAGRKKFMSNFLQFK
jgi:hypothetical protein